MGPSWVNPGVAKSKKKLCTGVDSDDASASADGYGYGYGSGYGYGYGYESEKLLEGGTPRERSGQSRSREKVRD